MVYIGCPLSVGETSTPCTPSTARLRTGKACGAHRDARTRGEYEEGTVVNAQRPKTHVANRDRFHWAVWEFAQRDCSLIHSCAAVAKLNYVNRTTLNHTHDAHAHTSVIPQRTQQPHPVSYIRRQFHNYHVNVPRHTHCTHTYRTTHIHKHERLCIRVYTDE